MPKEFKTFLHLIKSYCNLITNWLVYWLHIFSIFSATKLVFSSQPRKSEQLPNFTQHKTNKTFNTELSLKTSNIPFHKILLISSIRLSIKSFNSQGLVKLQSIGFTVFIMLKNIQKLLLNLKVLNRWEKISLKVS